MELANVSGLQLQTFLLVAARVTSALAVAPFFGSRVFPVRIKALLGILLALILLPLNAGRVTTGLSASALVGATLGEILVGLLAGFGASILFASIQFAASLMDVQIGFSLASAMDPVFAEQSTVLERLYAGLGLFLFLQINGHHLFLAALQSLFEAVPIDSFVLDQDLGERFVVLSSALFVTALQLALPVIAAVLLADVSIAIVGRVMPQLNIFAVGLPVKIGLGLLTLGLALPFFTTQLQVLFGGLGRNLLLLFR